MKLNTMISPLLMLALDSDVCPTSVPSPVAPLNTYTFLKQKKKASCGWEGQENYAFPSSRCVTLASTPLSAPGPVLTPSCLLEAGRSAAR